MSKHKCDYCRESFDTLTRKRLHNCSSNDQAAQTPKMTQTVETGSGEKDPPQEVEQGLEPEYDCPDCEYYKTGLTTGPHTFLDHLQEEHGYSESEASSILHGT